MATYWTTFRIDDRTVGGRSANHRREALYDTIRAHAHSKWWIEPTSFVLFTSEHSIDTLADELKSVVSTQFDVVLIRDAETKIARVIGSADPDLRNLMTYVQAA